MHKLPRLTLRYICNPEQIDRNGSKPVLFWIHGGAFVLGDGGDQAYGPQYLIREEIVIVSINYRLGALGKDNNICTKLNRRGHLG